MSKPVKLRRTYRSPLRDAQASQTRAAILDAARSLFTAQGWSKATVAAIARRAGISPETVYSVFGGKAAILQQLVQDAVRGDKPEVPLLDQAEAVAVRSEPDPRALVHRFAADIVAVLGRVAPLIGVVRTAAGTDPELHALYLRLHTGRRRNLAAFIAALERIGALRPGLTPEAALDHVFRIASPELFLMMREVEDLTPAELTAWIVAALIPMLAGGVT
jgi:AcrR family transcriptional regulator